jgi:CO/xanthine dehydrogenase Mo-binding subunit
MTTTGQSFLAARTRSAPQGFGRPISRKEDARLVTGRGRLSDDFNPHAHARVLSIESRDALAMPGAVAVLTGRDAAADGLGSIPHKPVPTNPNEFPLGGREGGRVHQDRQALGPRRAGRPGHRDGQHAVEAEARRLRPRRGRDEQGLHAVEPAGPG